MDLNSGAARITYQYIEPGAEAVDDEEFEVGGGGESDVDGVVSGFNVECRVLNAGSIPMSLTMHVMGLLSQSPTFLHLTAKKQTTVQTN